MDLIHRGHFRPLLLFACLLCAGSPLFAGEGQHAALSVLDPTLGATSARLDLSGFASETVTIRTQDFARITLDEEGWTETIGAPRMPRVTRSVLLPDTGAVEVQLLAATYHDIEGVEVAPYRGPIPRTQDPASVPYDFGPQYALDAFFPAELVSLREPFLMRDARGVAVEIHPLRFNPVTKVLRVYDELTFRVVTTDRPGVNELPPDSGRRDDASFARIFESHFINYQDLRYAPLTEVGDILVISHGAFIGAMQPYVDWKTSRGLDTTIVDVASIGNNASSIKSYITGIYNSSNLAYVLLVGDDAQVASGSYSGGRSDPYYSTITADWYPDIIVGRFSAQNTAQVDTQVQRTIEYESQDHGLGGAAWNSKAMGIASNEGPGHNGEYDNQHMNLIRNDLMADGFSLVDQIYEPSATKAMITGGLNDGRRLVHYCGHGSSSSWGTTGFSTSDVNNLTNVGMLPVIHSVACVNGQFEISTCFAEAWLRATSGGQPAGAAAAYMSSINQYWNEPMYAQDETVDLFCAEGYGSVGALWYAGSCHMMDAMGSSGRTMFLTWILFGDPALLVQGEGCDGVATNYCFTTPNSVGSGALISSNLDFSVAGNTFELSASAAPPDKTGVFFYGQGLTTVPLGDGSLCVGGALYRLPALTTDAAGAASLSVDFTSLPTGGEILGGSTWNFQFWYRDPAGGPLGFNASDGLTVDFCP